MHEFARVTSKGLSTVDIRTMRSFVAIVQTGSITHAAEELHVSQPALSRQIIELERELSCALLDRKGRSATPTAEGRLLYSRAQELIDLVEKTEAEIKHPDLAQGEVRISCSETPATALIARVVKQLTATHPGITVKFRSESSDDVTEHLSRGIADFGIVVGPARTDDFHIIGLPDIDTWGALLPREHPLATRHHISPTDLLGEPSSCPRRSSPSSAFATGWTRPSTSSTCAGPITCCTPARCSCEQGWASRFAWRASPTPARTRDSSLCPSPPA